MRGPLGISRPPTIDPQLKQTFRLRFSCTTAAVGLQITYRNLLDTIFVASAAAVGWDVFDVVKLKAVEVWAAPVQGGAPTPVRVRFTGNAGFVGDGHVVADTSMGVQPAHIIARPQKLSLPALWSESNTGVCFELTCPVGAVVDVMLAFRQVDTVAPVATAHVPVVATVGQFYFRGLDGLAVAGTTLPADAPLVN